MKVIDSLLNIIEMYINEIEKKKILLNEKTVKSISMIFFNMGLNEFKDYFDKNNRLNELLNLFKYLISQTLSPIQKETTNYISITICLLLKNERPPLCYGCVLEYVDNIKSSLSLTSGDDFPSTAKDSWDAMLEADSCLPEDFRVENGVLGLDRDCYLSVTKFLDSSTVRKV
jgi:hypothetical protein